MSKILAPVGSPTALAGTYDGNVTVTELPSGKVLLTWGGQTFLSTGFVKHPTSPMLRYQLLDEDLTPLTDAVQLVPDSEGYSGRVFTNVLEDGGFTLSWIQKDLYPGTGDGVFRFYAQQFDADGNALGAITLMTEIDYIKSISYASEDRSYAHIFRLEQSDGTTMIVVVDQDDDTPETVYIKAYQFDPSDLSDMTLVIDIQDDTAFGTPRWSDMDPGLFLYSLAAETTEDGGFILSWSSDTHGELMTVHPDGTYEIVETEVDSTSGTSETGDTGYALANGSTLYVEEQTSDDDTDVVARIEASDGSVLLDDVVVNHLTNGDQELSDVVVFEDGAGFAIVWSHSVEAYRLDANSGGSISYIQSYDINGTAVGMPYAVDGLYLFGSERDLVALSTELGRTITWFLGTTFSFDVDIEPIAAMTYYGLTTDEGRAVALDTRTIIGWKDVAIQRYLTFELFDGSASDDRLTGTADPDLMNGYAGNDWLNGLGGDDYINGAIGSDTLIGGAGNDTIKAGPDVLDLRDFVYAGAGDDSVMGGAGNDLIYGDAGDDTLEGQIGADQLVGGDGDDMLTGEALSDVLFGGDGIDFLNGGYGYDRLNGGDGADRFYHNGSAVFGSDWVQDYDSTEGDVLLLLPGYDAEDFHINYAETSGAGEAGVREAFVIYEATGQIIWALVDGEAQSEILLQIGGTVTDLVLS